MHQAIMQVLLLLLLVLPVVIMIVRCASTPIKARLATLKSVLTSKSPFMFVTDCATAHQLLVRGSKAGGGGSFSNRMPSMSPSAFLSGRVYNNITSAPYGQLWRTLRHNLTSGVLHPTHQHRYTAARRQALRGLIADLREQQLTNGVAFAAESIRGAVFGLVSTMCFGDDGVDAALVRAMDDVQMELVLSLSAVRMFTTMSLPFLVASRLIYRKRWNKLAAIRRKQEELYLPLIDGCRSHRRHSEESLTYVHTLLDLQVPAEVEADEAGAAGEKLRQQRGLEDGELVGLCSEFLGSGTETTVASLQWIMANLVKRPGMQEAVRREIEAAVDADAEEVGEEVLGNLDYLNAVILEALRLHPTTGWLFRQVRHEDRVVDHDGQLIPTGTTMVFVLEALGRDKTVWADPEGFKPERFQASCAGGEGTKNLLSSMAGETKMMPFGIGRRMCPAISMSLLHISYLMANLVREFKWGEVEGEHAIQLHPDPRIDMFNVMKGPLCAHLVPRQPEGKKNR